MLCLKIFIVIVIPILIITSEISFAQGEVTNHGAPLGFNFGMSKKEAIQLIKDNGKEITENSEDSKKIRTIIFEDTIVDLPLDPYKVDVQTRLEFFDDKLMSSSLIVNPENQLEHGDVADKIYSFLSTEYGDPETKEKVLNFYTWTWFLAEMKVVFTASRSSPELKVGYTHEPLSKRRAENELEQKRQGAPSDPAKEMLIDGTYSRPTEHK